MSNPNRTGDDERAQFTAGLHQIADWLDAHPEVPLPWLSSGHHQMTSYVYDKASAAACVRAMGRADKRVPAHNDEKLDLVREFSGIEYIVRAPRDEVCERVVVGRREVEVEEPDPAAVAALPKRRRTEVVEDVEWVCGSLLDDRDPAERGDAEKTAQVEDDAAEGASYRAEEQAELAAGPLPHRVPDEGAVGVLLDRLGRGEPVLGQGGGGPAQDPDTPPYASPMAYRAVPVHEVWPGRRWAW